jgi:hypothetical protein
LSVSDISNLELEKNKNRTIDLPIYTKENLTSFILIQRPSHGIINPILDKNNRHSLSVNYVPSKNYTGPDSFFYRVASKDITSNVGKVSVVINPSNGKLVFIATPEQRAGLAFGISVAIVLSIFLIVYLIIRGIRKRQQTKIKPKFWDIIRDDNWYPSLAIFQFLLWTGIVLFAYLGISLTRLISGVGPFIEMPNSLLLVMGISAAVPVTGAAISIFKYDGTTPTGVAPTKEVPSDQIRRKLPDFKTMLMENDRITLTRFQMFAWTWIGIIAYLGLLFIEVGGKFGNFENLLLPGLPLLFISLMGLSQVTYLTAKSVRPAFFSINEIRPAKVRLQPSNNLITILGSNFGNTGTLWVEYYPPVSDIETKLHYQPPSQKEINQMGTEEAAQYEEDWKKEYRYSCFRVEHSYDVTPKTPEALKEAIRVDNRIVVNLDSIKSNLKPQTYVVRVEKDGLLTYANSDATFEIIENAGLENTPPTANEQSTNTTVNKPVSIKLSATDPDVGDQLTYSKVTDPMNGKLSQVEPTSGKVTYTPNKDYIGDDSFTFKANNGKVDSNIATVNIKVDKETMK